MSENSRVIWTEGMFLRPHHFQQHDRYIESLITGRVLGLRSFDWGFSELKLDLTQLAIGRIAIHHSRGIFQDGTSFFLPENDHNPSALAIPESTRNRLVYLALPLRRADSIEIDTDQNVDPLARFRQDEREVRDYNAGADSRYPVQTGNLKLSLLLEGDELSGYLVLGVARVAEVRADKSVLLDDDYIAPALRCFDAGVLGSFIRELLGKLAIRGDELANRMGAAVSGAVIQMSDFNLLQLINRYEPLLRHCAEAECLHPEDLYRLSLQLAGELATFFRPERRPSSFSRYDHDDLQNCYASLMEELRWLLGKVKDPNAIKIPLQNPRPGIYGASRPDSGILENSFFVLAVKAEVPTAVIQSQFPMQVKIAPVEKIQQLVVSQLPGISISPLPAAPRQIPFNVGYSYFELDQQGPMWQELRNSGGFAFHIGGHFPDLDMEFWAIRKS